MAAGDAAPPPDPGLSVSQAHEVDLELVSAFARLVPQLSRSAPAPDADQLAEMLGQGGTSIFVARGPDGVIGGALTLVVFRIPTGVRAWIEDVVVDEALRGRGAGSALTRAALDKAAGMGARTVDLTSRPSREAANRLYERLGFRRRDTNVYRMTIHV